MPRKSWTVLVIPHNDIRVRRLRISGWLIAATALLCVSMVVSIIYLSILTWNKTSNQLKLINLQKENSLLTQKLNTIEGKMTGLNSQIGTLINESQAFRRIAGLDMLDEEVTEVGVGGTLSQHYDELFEMDSKLAVNLYSQEDHLETLLRKADLIDQSLKEAVESMKISSDRWAHYPSIKPSSGYVSSGFGRRIHPIYHTVQIHRAIDISTELGEPILSSANGTVISTNYQVGYGKTILVDHGYGIVTKYAHCNKISVKVGQKVKRGEVIGEVGQSGITTGPNLHYEVMVNGVNKNPLNFILDNYVP